jgi:hypothetical protein
MPQPIAIEVRQRPGETQEQALQRTIQELERLAGRPLPLIKVETGLAGRGAYLVP